MGQETNKKLKFVKQDKLSKHLVSLMSNENIKRSVDVISGSFNPSNVTECPRRIYYKSVYPFHSISYFEDANDKAFKNKWISYFSKCSKIRVVEKNVLVSDCNYNIASYVDTVIEILDCIVAVKILPIRSKEFKTIKKEGARKKDVIDLMMQTWLLEVNDGLLIYEDSNSNDYFIYHIEPYRAVIESVKKRCLDLYHQKIKGELPDRPYKTKAAKECSKCEFNQRCWEKEIV